MKPQPFLTRKPKGLEALQNGIVIAGIKYASWEELCEATGHTKKSLEKYLYRKSPLMPRPEPHIKGPHGLSLWRVDRQDVIDFVTGKTRPGRGYRTDIYGPRGDKQ